MPYRSNTSFICVQGALDWHPAPKPVLQAAIEAREKAASHGVDIGTLAIKEAVRPQGIAVTLVGMRTPEEVCRVASGGCTWSTWTIKVSVLARLG